MATRSPTLYSPELLALAVELADFPYRPEAAALGSARSRSCGSTIALSSKRPEKLDGVGLKVTACAVGQASAAIFAREALGMGPAEITTTLDALSAWLEDEALSTILPRLELLEPARAHRGRHEAILLPWRAALDALSNGETAR